jgi:hypothetical protein
MFYLKTCKDLFPWHQFVIASFPAVSLSSPALSKLEKGNNFFFFTRDGAEQHNTSLKIITLKATSVIADKKFRASLTFSLSENAPFEKKNLPMHFL